MQYIMLICLQVLAGFLKDLYGPVIYLLHTLNQTPQLVSPLKPGLQDTSFLMQISMIDILSIFMGRSLGMICIPISPLKTLIP